MIEPFVDDTDDVDVAALRRAPKGCETIGWTHMWHVSQFDPNFEVCSLCGVAQQTEMCEDCGSSRGDGFPHGPGHCCDPDDPGGILD